MFPRPTAEPMAARTKPVRLDQCSLAATAMDAPPFPAITSCSSTRSMRRWGDREARCPHDNAPTVRLPREPAPRILVADGARSLHFSPGSDAMAPTCRITSPSACRTWRRSRLFWWASSAGVPSPPVPASNSSGGNGSSRRQARWRCSRSVAPRRRPRFPKARGPGIHLATFEVPDLAAALPRIRSRSPSRLRAKADAVTPGARIRL